jgi:hypothetical protein
MLSVINGSLFTSSKTRLMSVCAILAKPSRTLANLVCVGACARTCASYIRGSEIIRESLMGLLCSAIRQFLTPLRWSCPSWLEKSFETLVHIDIFTTSLYFHTRRFDNRKQRKTLNYSHSEADYMRIWIPVRMVLKLLQESLLLRTCNRLSYPVIL